MESKYNILVTSISKKVPLIKAVRCSLLDLSIEGIIIGGDTNPDCIGAYFVDQFWEMPPTDDITIDYLIDYCRVNHVKAIIPTRDGELMFFAEHRHRLEQEGIRVMVSENVGLIIDKFHFFEMASGLGYSAVHTVLDPNELNADRWVVKERIGAGAKKMGLDLTYSEAVDYGHALVNPIYQPYIPGVEVSVDLYLDRNGKGKGVIARYRDDIVEGESQVTTSFRDEALESQCLKLAEDLKLYGHVMFQLIRSESDRLYHFLECNPRFGGASTLSLAMGLNSFTWFLLESMGKELPLFNRSRKDKRLVRHPEDYILSVAEFHNMKELSKSTPKFDYVTIRHQDMPLIKEWRNSQIRILRQKIPLTDADQERYWTEVIAPFLKDPFPNQLLYSILLDGQCIGYGGLVHIDWEAKRGEVSFLLDPKYPKVEEAFVSFLNMIIGVAFKEKGFHKLCTETFDVRPDMVAILEDVGFVLEGRLRDHVIVDGIYVDSLIHGYLLGS